MLPLSVVKSSSFKKYSQLLDPQFVVPSWKHLSIALLAKKDEVIKTKVRDILEQVKNVSLTLDLWSSQQMKGFLGITCHFILNWTMQSLMLECKRFKGRHTAENIAHNYDEVITSYNIDRKIVTTVTDNASNIVKAFSLPGFQDDSLHTNRDDEDNEGDEDEEDEKINEMDLHDSLDYVSEHDTCFAHTLQLVIKDGFKEIGTVSNILAKVGTIVAHARRSQHATEILEGERRLQLKNSTRWNSELRSIKSILRVPEDKLRLLDTVHLTVNERKILEDLVEILTPFQEATDFVQGGNVITSSLVIPCIRGLRKSLESLSVTYNSRMLLALVKSVDNRMAKYESRQLFILASTLDPRFKLRWCSGDDEEQKVKTILLRQGSQAHHLQTTDTTQVLEIVTTTFSEPLAKKRKKEPSKLLRYLFSETDPADRRGSNFFKAEVTSYLSKPCLLEDDPMVFWKDHATTYPTLAMLACSYLSVPASSGPVERLFSISGKFFRPERCRLRDAVFEKLMNIKCNGHLV